MAFTLNPNGETCSLEVQYPKGKELLDQVHQLLGGKGLNKKCGIQIYKVYKVCNVIVPEGWKFELAIQLSVFNLHDETFWKRTKSNEEFEDELLPSLFSAIKNLSDSWLEEAIRKQDIKTIQLELKKVKAEIENQKMESSFIKQCEIELNILSFLEQLVKRHKTKLKYVNLKKVIDEEKSEPEHLFDLWRLEVDNYFDRRRTFESLVDVLDKHDIITAAGNIVTWKFFDGRKKNPIIASFMFLLQEMKFIVFEKDRAKFYMDIFSKTFNVKLGTPADFSIESIMLQQNSEYHKKLKPILEKFNSTLK